MSEVTFIACLFDGADCSEHEIECDTFYAALAVCRGWNSGECIRPGISGVRPKSSILMECRSPDTNVVQESWFDVDLCGPNRVVLEEASS